jgi:flagellin-like protein
MKGDFGKRGISPVVASVLLIFLVIILAAIVFLWARGFLDEQLEKGGESVENQCRSVVLDARLSANYEGMLKAEIEFSNDGDVDVYGASIKEIGGDGNDDVEFYLLNLGKNSAMRLEISLGSSSAEELVVSPVLLAGVVGGNENKEFTCPDNSQRITL